MTYLSNTVNSLAVSLPKKMKSTLLHTGRTSATVPESQIVVIVGEIMKLVTNHVLHSVSDGTIGGF